MRTLYFVRHGQSLSNVGGVTVEDHAIPLTGVGRQQANALCRLLPQQPTNVFVSPFIRAHDTAEPYCEQLGLRATVVEGLHEFKTIDPVLIKGMVGEQRRPIADAFWAVADPAVRMGERAETFTEFVARVTHFHELVLPDIESDSVFFGHGMWMGMLFWKVLGFTSDDSLGMKSFRRFQMGFPMPNGAVYRLREPAPGHWTIEGDQTIMRQMIALAAA